MEKEVKQDPVNEALQHAGEPTVVTPELIELDKKRVTSESDSRSHTRCSIARSYSRLIPSRQSLPFRADTPAIRPFTTSLMKPDCLMPSTSQKKRIMVRMARVRPKAMRIV